MMRGRRFVGSRALAASAAGLAMAASVLIFALIRAPSPTIHAYGAVLAVLASYALLHLFIAVVMIAFVWMRARGGRPESGLRSERRIVRLWTDYAALVAGAAVLAIELPGWIA
jgi:cytochrome c oxidase subunit I+III